MTTAASTDNLGVARIERGAAPAPRPARAPAAPEESTLSLQAAVRRTAERRAAQVARGRRLRFVLMIPISVGALFALVALTSIMIDYVGQQ
jgi:hypothetical protein